MTIIKTVPAGTALSRRSMLAGLALAPAAAALPASATESPKQTLQEQLAHHLSEIEALMNAHVAEGDHWALWLTSSTRHSNKLCQAISHAPGKDATIIFDASEARS
ncbi:hypothetical protein MesoLj113c_14450 [Mesorhizobium sp. 113-3-9]|uniref:hypothetical protein n=1 Tax=Mesorhizobium sp. 113-3-9 TaxID=2744517 RepID=UPI001926997A|nr:hypothetical protein [Mesorhizobium sp. 113-3-9]BCG85335.1 hypothetical protein MesoLj113c_14450 [Mesorhizobium sp. 113-3-9]